MTLPHSAPPTAECSIEHTCLIQAHTSIPWISKRKQEDDHVNSEHNKEIVRRFYAEVWNQGNVEFAHEVFADDYVRHDLRPTSAGPGWQGQANIARDFRLAFPDLAMTLELLVAEDDLVAARWTAEGTFSGPWGDVQPTGRRATFSGVNIFRFGDGKVVELWNHRDDLGLMQQVGATVYAGSARSAELPRES